MHQTRIQDLKQPPELHIGNLNIVDAVNLDSAIVCDLSADEVLHLGVVAFAKQLHEAVDTAQGIDELVEELLLLTCVLFVSEASVHDVLAVIVEIVSIWVVVLILHKTNLLLRTSTQCNSFTRPLDEPFDLFKDDILIIVFEYLHKRVLAASVPPE